MVLGEGGKGIDGVDFFHIFVMSFANMGVQQLPRYRYRLNQWCVLVPRASMAV